MANITLQDIRQKYPEYNHLSDQDLSDKIYNKYYSEMPKDQFETAFVGAPISQQPMTQMQQQAQPEQKSTLDKIRDFIHPFIPSPTSMLPMGMNIGAGLASIVAGRNPQERSAISNLPQIALGAKPTLTSKLSSFIGQQIPSIMAGGPETGIAQKILSGGVMGAATSPEDRLKGFEGGAGIQSLFSTAGMAGKIIKQLMPDKYAQHIVSSLSSFKAPYDWLTTRMPQSLEQHGKAFAAHIKKTYERVKEGLSKEYNEFWAKNNLGEQRVIERKNPMLGVSKPTNYEKIDQDIIDSYNPDLRAAHDAYMFNPTVRNAHDLQSLLGGEERWFQRAIKRNNETSDKLNYARIAKARKQLQKDIHQKIELTGKGNAQAYKELGDRWQKEVIPYESNKYLKDIISGDVTNPKKSVFKNAFSYVDDDDLDNDTAQMLKHLGPNAKKDVMFQAIGEQPEDITKDVLIDKVKYLNKNGFEHYIDKSFKKNMDELNRTINPGKAAKYTTIGGLGALGGEYILSELKKALSNQQNASAYGETS